MAFFFFFFFLRVVAFAVLSDVLSASQLSSWPINFNRRSPEEFQWKIFLGEDLQTLAVLVDCS